MIINILIISLLQKPINTRISSYLHLENGKIFKGYSFGYVSDNSGEVVFNTGMTGYCETLTDPSYYGQILVLTYPLIGNYGIKKFNTKTRKFLAPTGFESGNIHVKGLIVSELSEQYSHNDAEMSLRKWLEVNRIPGIYGIDTRELTKILRVNGVMLGKITHSEKKVNFRYITDPNTTDLVSKVSIKKKLLYRNYHSPSKKSILLIDCGVKHNIIRNFIRRNIEVIRIPSNFDFKSLINEVDGLFISNGPGDPQKNSITITNVREYLKTGKPVFGICLGSQILAIAAGAKTFKLKYGHRSQNQPCQEVNGKCYITSQNHGYAVEKKSLSEGWEEWFFNNNDGTNEGIRHKRKPQFAVQFHPEGAPGPRDTEWLFDMFIDLL